MNFDSKIKNDSFGTGGSGHRTRAKVLRPKIRCTSGLFNFDQGSYV